MSLNRKQAEFTICVGDLLVYAFGEDMPVILAEAYRTPEQARIYKDRGVGILNSVHTKKLAVDLVRYKDGTISWDVADYQQLGAYWKTLHPDARWGGDFPRRRDAVHFSFIHRGIS